MTHFASPEFWEAYNALPRHVRLVADRNFELLKINQQHPSLQFKPVGRYWSARAGLQYRVLAVKDGDDFIWFWIGSHADYDRLVK